MNNNVRWWQFPGLLWVLIVIAVMTGYGWLDDALRKEGV